MSGEVWLEWLGCNIALPRSFQMNEEDISGPLQWFDLGILDDWDFPSEYWLSLRKTEIADQCLLAKGFWPHSLGAVERCPSRTMLSRHRQSSVNKLVRRVIQLLMCTPKQSQ